MAIKRRANDENQARLPWVRVEDYTNLSGNITAANFQDGSGDQLHLEHRIEHREVNGDYVIKWTSFQPIVAVARKLGELAGEGDKAHLLIDRRIRPIDDPRKLGGIVAHLRGVQLMRLQRLDSYIVWEREPQPKGDRDDLAVVAGGWVEAEEIAIHMGAGLEEGGVLSLVASIPRLAPLPETN